MAWVATNGNGKELISRSDHLELETIGLVTLYFIFQREVLRNSSEEICLMTMSQ